MERAHRNQTFIAAAFVFAVSLLIYIRTLAPPVTLVDSGELIVASRSLGVAHPPGFPLYLILAHLASLLPLGNVAVRVNFASAFFAALASAMMTLVVGEIISTVFFVSESRRRSKKAARKGKKGTAPASSASADQHFSWLIPIVPSVCTGLVFATSRTLWSYATIAEVYTLNKIGRA